MATLAQNMSVALRHELRARELIGRSNVMPASLALDRNNSTDLLIATGAGATVAMRTRTKEAIRYPRWEFTIRSRAVGGGLTEFDKLMGGYASHMFYGVLNEDETDYCRWMLINLSVWRDAVNEWRRDRAAGKRRWPIWDLRHNRDGSSFMVFTATCSIFRHPMFMADCWDHDAFPYDVAARRTVRTPTNDNVRHMLGRAA